MKLSDMSIEQFERTIEDGDYSDYDVTELYNEVQELRKLVDPEVRLRELIARRNVLVKETNEIDRELRLIEKTKSGDSR